MSRVVAGLAVLLTAVLTACSTASGAPPGPDLQVGVLATDCDPDRAFAQATAGVRLAVLDIAWDRYEPRPGEFDATYAAQVRGKVAACADAGVAVVLGPGMQYPPDWVLDLPAGRYRNAAGETPDRPVANLVFSRAVQNAATTYLARLDADLGLERFAAVRIGTTHTGELGFPDPGSAAGPAGAYWAFDDAAQNGAGQGTADLAAGASPSPLPGWVPGEPTWRGAAVTAEQARAWFRWYSDAVVASLRWQLDTLRRLGFAGDVHVPVAGRGVLPAALTAATARRLERVDDDGALGRGLDYPSQFPALARAAADTGPGRVVVDFTGLDDVAAVRARALEPPQDGCRPTDVDTVRSGDGELTLWPGQRFTTAVARLAGLPLVGENPGGPDRADTGGSPDSDVLAAQLRHAPRYARECGLTQFFWAFEQSLDDGASGVGMADLETVAHPRK